MQRDSIYIFLHARSQEHVFFVGRIIFMSLTHMLCIITNAPGPNAYISIS